MIIFVVSASAKLISGGRIAGYLEKTGDIHYRLRIPESLVKFFPNLPSEKN